MSASMCLTSMLRKATIRTSSCQLLEKGTGGVIHLLCESAAVVGNEEWVCNDDHRHRPRLIGQHVASLKVTSHNKGELMFEWDSVNCIASYWTSMSVYQEVRTLSRAETCRKFRCQSAPGGGKLKENALAWCLESIMKSFFPNLSGCTVMYRLSTDLFQVGVHRVKQSTAQALATESTTDL